MVLLLLDPKVMAGQGLATIADVLFAACFSDHVGSAVGNLWEDLAIMRFLNLTWCVHEAKSNRV